MKRKKYRCLYQLPDSAITHWRTVPLELGDALRKAKQLLMRHGAKKATFVKIVPIP